MLNLYKTSSNETGFRLQYMELYNWGTFDQQVFKITPTGNNSLLTGANGSGKTTFVDALVTLLVPLKKDRFYNQSSGVEKKGDRTEESYVLGHYGNIQKEGELSSTTQALRDKTTYSVILAAFANERGKTITLFQVRYFSNGQLKRAFGIAHQALNIAQDFSNFDNRGNWRRRLDKVYNQNAKRKQIEFAKGPTEYAQRMVQLLGMRSEKALNLFNQVVGIKVLGDLNEFIRENMLEDKDAEGKYINLKESFLTLMNAKNNIDKAKEQIAQLKPIDELAKKLSETERNIETIQSEREIAVYWFAQKEKDLAAQEIENLATKLVELEGSIELLKEEQDALRREEVQLNLKIERDEVGKQIRALTSEIKRLEKQRDLRKGKLEKYNELVQHLALGENPNEDIFYQQRNQAKTGRKQCEVAIETETEQLRLYKNQADALAESIQEGMENVRILQANKNNISGRVAAIRSEILTAIGATKEEIPFIGELIRVDAQEKDWEGAIEKLLHNFALRLIVPERFYQQVNQYVNATNLRGRITYQRYRSKSNTAFLQPPNPNRNALIHKLSFKPNNPYKNWVEQQIFTQFDYTCADQLDTFNRLEKAITKNGLIKFGRGKHEKDDRKHVMRKENYVLGWDNKEKLEWWRQEIKRLKSEEANNNQLIKASQQKIRGLNRQKDQYANLYQVYTQFDEINWEHYAQQVQEKRVSLQQLEAANNKVKVLQAQLKEVQGSIEKQEQKIDAKKDQKREVAGAKLRAEERLQISLQLLTKIGELTADVLAAFESKFPVLTAIVYANLPKTQLTFNSERSNQLRKLENRRSKLKEQILPRMVAFKNPDATITTKFKTWGMDVSQLPSSIEYVGEYQKKYEELVDEDLPRFEKKFNEYLEETITNKVGEFNHFITNWQDEIKQEISALNKALKEIDFNNSPNTYIQLVCIRRPKENVTEFENLLKAAIPNFRDMEVTGGTKRRHFEKHIQPFIERLEEEKWRTKVMQVRSWFEYRAEEFYRENDHKFKTYSGMGQLSGGEKAQLTYTILGSAIAYQFGLTKVDEQQKAFRFIAIDEAFKAQDEDKARYLMNLCKQLHLQLLVVTPSDNIHIVEPYISFVHYVERKNDRNSWLYDMPIEQFQEEREKYSTIQMTHDYTR